MGCTGGGSGGGGRANDPDDVRTTGAAAPDAAVLGGGSVARVLLTFEPPLSKRMSRAAVTSPPTIASAERASASDTDGSTSCTAAIAAARAGGVAPAPCEPRPICTAPLCGPTAAQSSNIPPRRPSAVLPAAKAPPRFAERPASSAHASRPRPRCSRLHGAAAEVGSLCLGAQVNHRWPGGFCMARHGTAWHETAWHGTARRLWHGTACNGMARHGTARTTASSMSTCPAAPAWPLLGAGLGARPLPLVGGPPLSHSSVGNAGLPVASSSNLQRRLVGWCREHSTAWRASTDMTAEPQ